ncbi:Amino oxidase, NAD binding 8, and/or DAO domain containing protein [Asbolus verrucosus]|uniref:Protoporphyrinogen oxidase n=1 Tax=Asbolus verrucosus TaxID=1661398 RepID=A0A482W8M2_ASBVE|nr:Amino oxidase, NAD binding 8, and/or DAO domain containing protein [Asbolus verrucosus]
MSKAILGGGLSGLSAAYYLSKNLPNQSLTLIEASGRTGGWIKSNLRENGIIFEQGPRTIRPRGAAGQNTLQLIEDLGLSDKIIPILSNSPAAKNRMIYAKGGLHMVPSSLGALFKKQEPFTKPLISYLLNDLKTGRKRVQDESIYDFIDRRFGEEVADYLISPLICGVCAGNAKEISVKFLMKELFEYEQKYGSVSGGIARNLFTTSKKSKILSKLSQRAKREKWNIYSFTDGCETLPVALRDSIIGNNVNIILNTECKEIVTDKNKIILHLSDNKTNNVDHLISAVPSTNLGSLVEKQHPELAHFLKKLVKNVSVAVVNLHFAKDVLKNAAFGLLVAPREHLPILGIIYDSCCFPKNSTGTVLTVMMGGHWFQHYFGENPEETLLLDTALSQLKQILHINDAPIQFKVNVLHHCLPQYVIGHNDSLLNINNYINKNKLPMSICGASYHGVGINDVILSAKNAVHHLTTSAN